MLFRGGQREAHLGHEGVEVGVLVRANVSVDVFVSAVRCLSTHCGVLVGQDLGDQSSERDTLLKSHVAFSVSAGGMWAWQVTCSQGNVLFMILTLH